MIHRLRRLLAEDSGLSMPEYAVIGAVVLLGIVGGIEVLGGNINSIVTSAADSATGPSGIPSISGPAGGGDGGPGFVSPKGHPGLPQGDEPPQGTEFYEAPPVPMGGTVEQASTDD